MSMIPPRPPQQQINQPPIVIRPAPRRYRFRWGCITVPLVILGMLYLISGMSPAFAWADVLNLFNVAGNARITNLGILALILIAIVSVIRVLRHTRDD